MAASSLCPLLFLATASLFLVARSLDLSSSAQPLLFLSLVCFQSSGAMALHFFSARELCSSRVRCSSPLPRLPPCSLREPRPSDQSQPSSLQLQPGSIHGRALLLVGARRGRRRSVAPSLPAPISLVKLPWRAASSSRTYLAGSPSRAAFLHLPVCRGARIAPRLLCLLGARLLRRLAAASLCAPRFFIYSPSFQSWRALPARLAGAPCALLAHGVCRAPFLLGRAPTESPMAAPWDLPESASLAARCFFPWHDCPALLDGRAVAQLAELPCRGRRVPARSSAPAARPCCACRTLLVRARSSLLATACQVSASSPRVESSLMLSYPCFSLSCRAIIALSQAC
jgi:hypothetical protein